MPVISKNYFLSKGIYIGFLRGYLRFVKVQAGAISIVLLLIEFHLNAVRSLGNSRRVRRRAGRRVLRQIVPATRRCARSLFSAMIRMY